MNTQTTLDFGSMSREELMAFAAEAEASRKALLAAAKAKVSLKVSEKGALSVYGLGRFPVTLYAGQWERLLALAPDITRFIAANQATLTRKE